MVEPNAARGMEDERVIGSYHCPYFKSSGKCDVCKHMVEKRDVMSGHNVHPPASQTTKLLWLVYMEECVHREGAFQYIGSTTSITERWSNTKSRINLGREAGTGLETH